MSHRGGADCSQVVFLPLHESQCYHWLGGGLQPLTGSIPDKTGNLLLEGAALSQNWPAQQHHSVSPAEQDLVSRPHRCTHSH